MAKGRTTETLQLALLEGRSEPFPSKPDRFSYWTPAGAGRSSQDKSNVATLMNRFYFFHTLFNDFLSIQECNQILLKLRKLLDDLLIYFFGLIN